MKTLGLNMTEQNGDALAYQIITHEYEEQGKTREWLERTARRLSLLAFVCPSCHLGGCPGRFGNPVACWESRLTPDRFAILAKEGS